MNIVFFRNLVVLNGLIPALILAWDGYRGQLGANAANNALHITGILSLVFLFLSLVVTPVRVMTGWTSLVAYRRALGLYGFFYAAVHFAIYIVLDRMGSLSSTVDEILSRRFLLVGFVAITLMVPLAITSTNAMIRRIGPTRWKRLHRLAYLATSLGVVHYYMLVKSDVRQPLAFAAVLTPILGFRTVKHYIDLRRNARLPKTNSAANSISKFFNGELLVANIQQETHNVRTFRFVNPKGGDVPFVHKPGQYMNLMLTIDGVAVRRSYTIASAPSQHGHVELTIKRESRGIVSRYMHDELRVGDTVRIGAPAGKFYFDGNDASSVVLISGGVGITPLMSMLRDLADRAWSGSVYFVNAVRAPEDFIFLAELQSISRRFRNVHVLNYFSRSTPKDQLESESSRWSNRSGYINAEGLRAFVPDLSTTLIFLCGPDAMMESVRAILASLDIPSDNVSTEAFVSPKAVVEPEHVSATSGLSTATIASSSLVTFVQSGRTIEVSGEQTILEGAEASDVALAWECRSGICGQCKVRCTSGQVRMSSRDALSRSEEADGYILACQAHAVSEEITVDL